MDLDLKPAPPKPPRQRSALWGLIAGLAVVMMVGGIAAVIIPQSLTSPQRRAIERHIRHNAGKPESVEVIDFSGPRNVADRGYAAKWCYRVKYRSENPMGGMSVLTQLYAILPDGSVERMSANREQFAEWVGWEALPAK